MRIHIILLSWFEIAYATVTFPFLGDWGQPGIGLDMVGANVRNRTYDFLILGGDNFYDNGVSSVHDSQFSTTYASQFGSLEIPQYVILGNHDYFGNPLAQLLYSQYDSHWNAEYYYYSRIIEVADVKLCAVFIDTEDFSQSAQLSFLHTSLSACTLISDWVFVFGHHPVFSSGGHGDSQYLKDNLQPVLDMYKVDFYVSGHDHVFSHHQDNGVNYIVSGGTSKRTTSPLFSSTSQANSTLFKTMAVYGFAHFEVLKKEVKFSIIDVERNASIYQFSKSDLRTHVTTNAEFPVHGTTPWSATYIWLLIVMMLLIWTAGVMAVTPYRIVAQFK